MTLYKLSAQMKQNKCINCPSKDFQKWEKLIFYCIFIYLFILEQTPFCSIKFNKACLQSVYKQYKSGLKQLLTTERKVA